MTKPPPRVGQHIRVIVAFTIENYSIDRRVPEVIQIGEQGTVLKIGHEAAEVRFDNINRLGILGARRWVHQYFFRHCIVKLTDTKADYPDLCQT